jgi:hypothetical protein
VIAPGPEALATFLGWPPFDAEQTASAEAQLARSEALCKAYTRGRGWIGHMMDRPSVR